MMKNPNQLVMDNLVCIQLFNLSYEEFIAEAKRRAGKDWNYIDWNDDMESARDWLTADALRALADAEGAIANGLRSSSAMLGKLTLVDAMAMAHEIIKDMRVPDDKIWSA